MVSTRYANAMREVLQYLKGIREEDINKIPKSFISFLEENASTEYNCDVDYTKPLKDLELMDESKGIIGLICYKYWCDTEDEKQSFLDKLNENEKKFQEQLREKYDSKKIFNKINEKNREEKTELAIMKQSKKVNLYKRIVNFIKNMIKK